GVALLAVGAYGRRELCPASDLDLVLLHDGRRGRDVGALADRVWYPIWDSGFRLDHSVRTPDQARAIADNDLKAALGLPDGRDVAVVRALTTVTDVVVVDDRFAHAVGALFDARVALQRIAGRTDRLLLEHQDEVASALEMADADLLMTRLSTAARTIASQSDE